MKIQITEEDIRLMTKQVVKALNESDFGFGKGRDYFMSKWNEHPRQGDTFNGAPNDNDFPFRETEDENIPVIVTKVSKDVIRQAQSFLQDVEKFNKRREMILNREAPKIDAWMDAKGITSNRGQIKDKLIRNKIADIRPSIPNLFRCPEECIVISGLYGNPERAFIAAKTNYQTKMIDFDAAVERARELSDIKTAEEFVNNAINHTREDDNAEIGNDNLRMQNDIKGAKFAFPECFDGTIDNYSYVQLRDLRDKMEAFSQKNWREDNKAIKQGLLNIKKKMDAMLDATDGEDLGWANSWKKDDRNHQIVEKLLALHKENPKRVIWASYDDPEWKCVHATTVVIVDDKGMPEKVYGWQSDSSD